MGSGTHATGGRVAGAKAAANFASVDVPIPRSSSGEPVIEAVVSSAVYTVPSGPVVAVTFRSRFSPAAASAASSICSIILIAAILKPGCPPLACSMRIFTFSARSQLHCSYTSDRWLMS